MDVVARVVAAASKVVVTAVAKVVATAAKVLAAATEVVTPLAGNVSFESIRLGDPWAIIRPEEEWLPAENMQRS